MAKEQQFYKQPSIIVFLIIHHSDYGVYKQKPQNGTEETTTQQNISSASDLQGFHVRECFKWR